MTTIGNERRFVRLNAVGLVGLFALSVLTFQGRAEDQPQPGPEQKKLEVWVGDWTYEGSSETSPFGGTVGKFAGKETCRMILNGFVLESHWEDRSGTGYISQGVTLRGYDSAART